MEIMIAIFSTKLSNWIKAILDLFPNNVQEDNLNNK